MMKCIDISFSSWGVRLSKVMVFPWIPKFHLERVVGIDASADMLMKAFGVPSTGQVDLIHGDFTKLRVGFYGAPFGVMLEL